MATRMLQRRGTTAEWTASNEVLGDGEFGLDTDTNILKIGDGVTGWNELPLSNQYLRADAKAVDSDKLDGLDSTQFLRSDAKAVDAELLDGLDSTQFLRVNAKAVDADKLDGLDSTAYVQQSLVNGKGELLIGLGDDVVGRLPAGTQDFFLIADSTTATGFRYGTPPAASFGFAEVFLHGGG